MPSMTTVCPAIGLVEPEPWMTWIGVAASPQTPKPSAVLKENATSAARGWMGSSWSATPAANTVTVQVVSPGSGAMGVSV